jgi:hypothetical protein
LPVPLLSYTYDPDLATNEEIVLTVKTVLQLEKNEYQAELMRQPNLGVFGREAARPYVLGIVAGFSLAHERFNWNLAETEWSFSAVEPYGLDTTSTKMALASASSVKLFDLETGAETACESPWLNQGHTVEFSPDGTKLLVGSAGFDAVFEFDTTTGNVVWEWFAWDHGFDRSKLGHYLVRSQDKFRALTASGHEALLVNPKQYQFGIPTRKKPAHLNSAHYNYDGTILITLFHQGAGYLVSRDTGEPQEVISGLSNPHKLSSRQGGGYFICDTKGGKLLLLDSKHCLEYAVSLLGMPGVMREPSLSEFLQNATELRQDLFACVDIHRSSLWLIDIKRRTYRGVKFPVEWSVHDVAGVRQELNRRLGDFARTHFGKVATFAPRLKTIHHFDPNGRETAATLLRPI